MLVRHQNIIPAIQYIEKLIAFFAAIFGAGATIGSNIVNSIF